ncbi:MAG: polyribonucleotide nucleotidyltransferase, partial [Armatimonadetes bacterium]|nr:polyribonucleotide nucleotidyltransferase [Armatimonadota bacterium]
METTHSTPQVTRVTFSVGDAPWTFETGKLAKQAGGAVIVRYGDTVVLVTATGSAAPRPDIDFFPLTCDYEEKMYAAGKIPGGFFKREGRPGEKAILTSRLIDRPCRPLFPKGFRNDVQVVATAMSVDLVHAPDVAAVVGASAALSISDVPWDGPIGCVRIGLVDGALVVNPTMAQSAEASRLDLIVAASDEAIIMVECGADEVTEAQMVEALELAHAECRKIIAAIRELTAKAGKPKRDVPLYAPDAALAAEVAAAAEGDLDRALRTRDKRGREEAVDEVLDRAYATLWERYADRGKELRGLLDALQKDLVRRMILTEGVRTDGRDTTQIRALYAEVGLMPRTHGSGLFQRGQTQVLTLCTLGTGEDAQIIDDLSLASEKRYMHHYSFPPYSVGEVRPLRSPGRREIGHGALAERALLPVLPTDVDFPYTIRLVSEVLESNGSTSMASVCGSTLALMDAGVPIRKPVGGIAMGLITGKSNEVAILTDIQGIEDAMGDMDFKVAGTRDGITALQMDIKIKGLTRDLMARALDQARDARLQILDVMTAAIPAPRAEMSKYAPRLTTIEIPTEKIREVIGPGGKVINKITSETGVKIDIEQDGRVIVASTDGEAAERAIKMIQDIVRVVEVGQVYTGKVTRILNFGAFVEILPNKEGLVHISKLQKERTERVEDVVNMGDEIEVRVEEIDAMGRVNLTRRGLLPG